MKNNTTIAALFCIILNGILLQGGLCQKNGGSIGDEPNLTGELFSTERLNADTWFNKEWAPGEILLADGSYSVNNKIRYNSLLDELFWLEPVSGKIVKLDKGSIEQFRIIKPLDNTIASFRRLHVDSNFLADTADIFAEVLYTGGITLYLRHNFYFQGTELTGPSNKRRLKDIYRENPEYYIKLNDNNLVEVHFLRKNLYLLFPDKKEPIKKYFRENAVRSPAEITSFVEFLDNL